MKNFAPIIFVSVVTIIYSLVNYFLFVKGYKLLPNNSYIKYGYIVLFLFLATQFIIGRVAYFGYGVESKFLLEVGGIWLAAILYFLLLILLGKIIFLSDKAFHFLPDLSPHKFNILLSSIGIVLVLLFVGYINAKIPVVKNINLKINKQTSLKQLKIALVSDVHVGSIIGYKDMQKMLASIEEQQPDIFIMTGDFIDEGVSPALVDSLQPLFDKLQPKYGKIAILGNHEYINKIDKSLPVFEQLGMTLLRDSVLTIEEQFVVVGRDDYSAKQMSGVDRKNLPDLLKEVETKLPLILLDHQPYKLKEVAQLPVDLQLSGHTHHGQMFPLNYLTKAIFEVSWGYKKIANTHFYVTSGYGTWGPRIRLGNRPELVLLNLQFKD